MKGRPRFYAPDMTADSAVVTLPDDEAAHLVRVLRLGPGDAVHVLDGRGLLREAQVASASKAAVTLDLGAAIPAAVESRVRVTLAQALLKGDKMDDVVRDAAMAGAFAIQPIVTAHTEPSILRAAERRHDRWRTIAIGSAKQSGRAVVPHDRRAAAVGRRPLADGRCSHRLRRAVSVLRRRVRQPWSRDSGDSDPLRRPGRRLVARGTAGLLRG